MKAICSRDGSFKGLIPDIETYQKLQAGSIDWKPHLKARIKTVDIPYGLFEYFMELDTITPNELKLCDFCCCLDFKDSKGKTKVYPKENYNFYAGYSKQIDVDEFDEFETENINYCPVCGRCLKQEG